LIVLEYKDAASFSTRVFCPALITLVVEGNSLSIILQARKCCVILVVHTVDTLRESFPGLSERKGNESRTPVL